jgi:hypothetical protein
MDAALSRAVRDAEARDDGPTWAAASQAHLRAGQLEQAAVAARRAIARGTDAMELLDAAAPTLDALQPRVIDVRRRARTRRHEDLILHRLAWAPLGGALLTIGPSFATDLLRLDLVDGSHEVLVPNIANLHAVAFDGPTAIVTRGGRARPEGYGVAVVDLDRRSLAPLRRVSSFDVSRIEVTSRPGVAFVVEHTRTGAVAIDLTSRTSRRLLRVPRGGSFDGTGALAYDHGDELVLHDPLDRTPRVRVRLRPCSQPWGRMVFACGLRALVLEPLSPDGEEQLTLHDVDGQVLGECPRVAAGPIRPSPTGRLCLLGGGPFWGASELLEVRTGRRRKIDLPGDQFADAVWSPSGRRLAIMTFNGRSSEILLLEPGPISGR